MANLTKHCLMISPKFYKTLSGSSAMSVNAYRSAVLDGKERQALRTFSARKSRLSNCTCYWPLCTWRSSWRTRNHCQSAQCRNPPCRNLRAAAHSMSINFQQQWTLNAGINLLLKMWTTNHTHTLFLVPHLRHHSFRGPVHGIIGQWICPGEMRYPFLIEIASDLDLKHDTLCWWDPIEMELPKHSKTWTRMLRWSVYVVNVCFFRQFLVWKRREESPFLVQNWGVTDHSRLTRLWWCLSLKITVLPCARQKGSDTIQFHCCSTVPQNRSQSILASHSSHDVENVSRHTFSQSTTKLSNKNFSSAQRAATLDQWSAQLSSSDVFSLPLAFFSALPRLSSSDLTDGLTELG